MSFTKGEASKNGVIILHEHNKERLNLHYFKHRSIYVSTLEIPLIVPEVYLRSTIKGLQAVIFNIINKIDIRDNNGWESSTAILSINKKIHIFHNKISHYCHIEIMDGRKAHSIYVTITELPLILSLLKDYEENKIQNR